MRTRQLVVFSAALALLLAGCSPVGAPASSAPTPTPVSEVVFKSPEDAINAYFDGLKQNDVQKILRACAVNEMSEKFDFAGYVDRLGGALQPSIAQAPTDYPLYIEANKLQLSSQILNRVKMFAYSLLSARSWMKAACSLKWMPRVSTTL